MPEAFLRKELLGGRGLVPVSVLLFANLVAVSSCSLASTPSDNVLVADSAGVVVVEVQDLTALRPPEWRTRQVFSTEDEKIDLFDVQGAVLLPDSSLVIANAGTSELVQVDARGKIVRRIGTKGKGPGEYQWIKWLGVDSQGSIWVYDPGLLRLTRLDSQLRLVETHRVHSGEAFVNLAPLAVDGAGRMLSVHGENRHFYQGDWRDSVPLLRHDLSGGSVDTVGVWLGDQKFFRRTDVGTTLVPIGFARRLLATGKGDLVVIGSTDSLRVSVHTVTGRVVMEIRGFGPPKPVPEVEERKWRQHILERAPITTPSYLAIWEEAPVRETYPAFGGLALDPQQRVWVAAPARPTKRRRMWYVFARTGYPVGRVDLPFSLPHPLFPVPEILDISDDHIAILRSNEWGEQFVDVVSYTVRE